MRRNHGKAFRYHGLYRNDLLEMCRRNAGLSAYRIAKDLDLNQDTVSKVFKGTASQKQVWPIAEFFGIDWKIIHDLTLSPDEFHRVVLSGDSGSVR